MMTAGEFAYLVAGFIAGACAVSLFLMYVLGDE